MECVLNLYQFLRMFCHASVWIELHALQLQILPVLILKFSVVVVVVVACMQVRYMYGLHGYYVYT